MASSQTCALASARSLSASAHSLTACPADPARMSSSAHSSSVLMSSALIASVLSVEYLRHPLRAHAGRACYLTPGMPALTRRAQNGAPQFLDGLVSHVPQF